MEPDTIWKTHSTKGTYEGYLNKWILPRWGRFPWYASTLESGVLVEVVAAGEIKLRQNQESHERSLQSWDPTRHLRSQSDPACATERETKDSPVILIPSEVLRLISVLAVRERTLVLLAFGTGLRMSELFGLKWDDIDFQKNEISVTRSIVFQVVGPCKTEASQKPVPLDPFLAEALHTWRQHIRYRAADDWGSPAELRVGKNRIGDTPSCEPSFVRRRRRSVSQSTSDGTPSVTRILHC